MASPLGSAPSTSAQSDAPDSSTGDVTVWLDRWECGERDALDAVLPLVYDELRKVARRVRRRERPDHTLATTALVHEAYLRLARRRQLGAADRADFLALAGLAMRRILVDHARTRLRAKRGAGVEALPLEPDRIDQQGIELPMTVQQAEEMLDIDRSLGRLRKADRRAAWVVQQRIFVGATVDEIARELKVSAKTVQRDWNTGIAWLRKEVRGGRLEGAPGHS